MRDEQGKIKEAPAFLCVFLSVTDNYLEGLRFSCIFWVAPVISSACGLDEICHFE